MGGQQQGRYFDPEQSMLLGESLVDGLERNGASTTDAVNASINMCLEAAAFNILRTATTPAEAMKVAEQANKYLTEFVAKLKDIK